MAVPDPPEYDVFLSYAGVDAPQARALELGLQRLARPWYRARAMRVFRDRSVLPAGDATWPALQERLDHSRWLVLLASPEAAASSWVGDEVAWWRRHHTVDDAVRRLIVVRTDGTLAWHEADVDWAATTCLPTALRGGFRQAQTWAELPRPPGRPYVDLLPAAMGGSLRRRSIGPMDRQAAAVLLDAVADVAATVRGLPKEEMVGEHRRQARRTGATVVATVAVVLALVAGLFVVQRQADDRRNAGIAANLVQRAAAARDIDPRLALRLGIAADELHPDPRTRAGLVDTLTTTRYRGQMTGEGVAFDPSRTVAATVDYSGTTELWDVAGPGPGRKLGESGVGRGGIGVAFAPAGHLMATGLASGALVLDDVTDPAHPAARGRTPDTRTVSAGVVAPVFTPDGKRLVTAAADTPPTVWDVTAPDQPRIGATLSGPGAAALAVAPDGRTLAVATSGAVALWDIVDVPRRLATLPARAEAVSGLAFSAAGLLAVAGLDRVTQLWAVGDPAAPRLLGVAGGHTQGVTAVAFSPDGERMVTGGVDGTTRLWDTSRPTAPRELGKPQVGRTEAVRAVAFSADGKAYGSSGDERMTLLWSAADPALPGFAGPPVGGGGYTAAAVDPDGRTAAVLGPDRALAVLDLAGTTPPRPLRTDDEVVALAYAPVGHTLAGAGSVAVVWDTAGVPQQRAELAEPPVDGFTTISTALAFTPDGRRLAAAFEDGNAQVFDIARGAPEGLPVTGKKVSTLAFSPDGRTLALGSYLGETLLYDIAEPDGPTLVGAPLAGEPGPRNFLVSLAFSPDSAILAATSGDGTAILWNTANRAAPTRIGAPFNAANGAAISDVTFSRDGTLLLVVSADGHLVVRDLTDPLDPVALGQPLAVEPLLEGSLTALPDGHTVLAGGWSGGLGLADIAPLLDLRDHARARACTLTATGFDADEWSRYVRDVGYVDSCSA